MPSISTGKGKQHRVEEKTNGTRSTYAWTALEGIIRLADVAQIPLVGGAFTIFSEVLTAFNCAGDNVVACKTLLETLSTYAETIWEFVNAISLDSLRLSEDAASLIARNAIITFSGHIDDVYQMVRQHQSKNRFERLVFHSPIRAEIALREKQLVQSHKRFRDAVSNVLVAEVRCRKTNAPKADLFKIPGVKTLAYSDLKITNSVAQQMNAHSFWRDASLCELQSQPKLVKIYYAKSGGKDAFLRDMRRLARNPRHNLAMIYGYCEESNPPFIVFTSASVTPYQDHISRIATDKLPHLAVIDVWNMFIDMREAARFLVDNNDCIDWQVIAATLKDGRVDEKGQIVLAPHWQDWHEDTESEPEILKSHIDSFIELHAYTMRECRPLRSLWYGILGNFESVLGERPPTSQDASEAVARLRESWPSCAERSMSWPQTIDRRPPNLGDIGVFEIIPRRGTVFRKLANISDELGGGEIELEPSPGVDLLPGGVIRVEIIPDWDEASYEDGSSYFESDSGLQYIEEDDYQEVSLPPYEDNDGFQCFMDDTWPSTDTPNSVDEFGCNWILRLGNRHEQWSFLSRNAKKLGDDYGVPPEDLVLVTETNWYMCTEAIAIDVPHDQPLYLFIHPNESELPMCYWTFDPEPRLTTAEEMEDERLAMELLGCPEPVIDFEDPRFVQLEATDIIRS